MFKYPSLAADGVAPETVLLVNYPERENMVKWHVENESQIAAFVIPLGTRRNRHPLRIAITQTVGRQCCQNRTVF